MTWNELHAAIEKMSPKERGQEVRFIEPYDKEKAGYNVLLHFAREDLLVGGGDEPEEVFVRRDEPFLQ